MSPAEVTYLGEGCDSWTFEVNRQWVLRFPKCAEVERQLALESRVLPVLAEQSPLRTLGPARERLSCASVEARLEYAVKHSTQPVARATKGTPADRCR